MASKTRTDRQVKDELLTKLDEANTLMLELARDHRVETVIGVDTIPAENGVISHRRLRKMSFARVKEETPTAKGNTALNPNAEVED